jgi:cytochrome P450
MVADRPAAARAFLDDPHPLLHRLRASSPIHWHEQSGRWNVSSYELCDRILRDRRFRMVQPAPEAAVRGDDAASAMRGLATNMLLETEGTTHARLRTALSAPFSVRAVARLRGRAQEITEGLFDRLGTRTRFDLVPEVAYQLPVAMISEIIGIPPEERDEVSQLCGVMTQGGGRPDRAPTAAEMATAASAFGVFSERVLRLARARRTAPRDDLISHLVAGDPGPLVSDDELVANAFALYLGGHETTKNLIASGMLTLLSDRARWRQVWDSPDVVEDVVQEMLRYETPLSFTMREACADVDIGGVRIRRGQQLQVLLCAANRDPDRYPDPDAFVLGRPPRQVLSFGVGQHFCLGAHLATMEASVALRTMIDRFEDIRLDSDEPFVRTRYFVHRGLDSLPVVVTPRGGHGRHV